MSVLGSMVSAVEKVVSGGRNAVTKSQPTSTEVVRAEVGGGGEGKAAAITTTTATATLLSTPPATIAPLAVSDDISANIGISPAWPTLALYDEAIALRARFVDLITTKAIYSLTVNHLARFDKAWRGRSISALREVYWDVLKRWCSEEGARAVSAQHDKLIKSAQERGEVLQKVSPRITIIKDI